MSTWQFLLYALLCLCSGGCTFLVNGAQNLSDDVHRHTDELRERQRYQQLAEKALQEYLIAGPYCSVSSRFSAGFQEGYVDYLFWGGKQCTPPLLTSLAQKEAAQAPNGGPLFQEWLAGFQAGHQTALATYPDRAGIILPLTALPGLAHPIAVSANALPCADPGTPNRCHTPVFASPLGHAGVQEIPLVKTQAESVPAVKSPTPETLPQPVEANKKKSTAEMRSFTDPVSTRVAIPAFGTLPTIETSATPQPGTPAQNPSQPTAPTMPMPRQESLDGIPPQPTGPGRPVSTWQAMPRIPG